jgi:hypothetical protein
MYKIGQVVWLISESSKRIEPVKVDSRTTVENENGVVTHHHAKTTGGASVSIEKQGVPVFESLQAAKAHLMDLAAEMVNVLAADADKKARASFQERPSRDEEKVTSRSTAPPHEDPTQVNPAPDTESLETTADLSDEVHMVKLPDGTKARFHLPSDLS